MFILLSLESDQSAITSSLRSYRPSLKWEIPLSAILKDILQLNLPACSPHCSLMLSVKREADNTNFKVFGLTRLGTKP